MRPEPQPSDYWPDPTGMRYLSAAIRWQQDRVREQTQELLRLQGEALKFPPQQPTEPK